MYNITRKARAPHGSCCISADDLRGDLEGDGGNESNMPFKNDSFTSFIFSSGKIWFKIDYTSLGTLSSALKVAVWKCFIFKQDLC